MANHRAALCRAEVDRHRPVAARDAGAAHQWMEDLGAGDRRAVGGHPGLCFWAVVQTRQLPLLELLRRRWS